MPGGVGDEPARGVARGALAVGDQRPPGLFVAVQRVLDGRGPVELGTKEVGAGQGQGGALAGEEGDGLTGVAEG
ncbi:hypothetical protein ACO0M4_08075 [Streptomyces sp. RGM 3693]|uniref:hypothetical protein n=1 Tax=Streptomyces sp. RGM 3693 TaxID=3413284 RepID=UPI003D2885CA